MYQLHRPAQALEPYIDNYWILQSQLPTEQTLNELIFVDGKADVIFNFGEPYQRILPDQQDMLPTSNLDGQRVYPVSIVQTGYIDLVGVRFKVGGLSAFLPMSAQILLNQVVAISDIFGSAIQTLEGRLFDARQNPADQIAQLNDFFLTRLQLNERDLLTRSIARTLNQNYTMSMRAVSTQYGYSVRSIERFFNHTMGFTPKFYTRIIRLNHALEYLSDTQHTLIDIALRLGYYDQAHFSHDFKSFTGQTPAEYRTVLQNRRAQPPPNLVHFLQDSKSSS